jgi:hypothetical protein
MVLDQADSLAHHRPADPVPLLQRDLRPEIVTDRPAQPDDLRLDLAGDPGSQIAALFGFRGHPSPGALVGRPVPGDFGQSRLLLGTHTYDPAMAMAYSV